MEEFFGLLLGIAFFGFIIWLTIPSSKKKTPQSIQDFINQGIISWDQAEAIQTFERTERIQSWVKHKLITPEQAAMILPPREEPQAIKAKRSQPSKTIRENTSATPTKTFHVSVLTAICYLALGSILLGIIALVAANYDKIPPSVRAMSTLFWLCVTSFAVFWTHIKGKQRAKELFIVAGVGLIGANIGTISQWFQLSGNPMDALFWWAILSVFFIWISAKNFWALLWYPALALTFIFSSYMEPVINFLTYRIPSPLAGAFGIITLCLVANQLAPNHNLVRVLKYWCLGGIVALCALFDADLSLEEKISFPLLSHTSQTLRSIWALAILSAYPIYTLRSEKQILWTLCSVLGVALFTAIVHIPCMGALTTLFLLMLIALYTAKGKSEFLFNSILFVMFMRLMFVHFPSPMAAMMGFVTLTLIGYRIAPGHKLHDLFKIGSAIACIIFAVWFDFDLTDQKNTFFPIFRDTGWALRNIWALLILSAYPLYVMRKSRLAVCALLGVLAVAIMASLINAPILGITMTLLLLSLVAIYVAKKNDLASFNFVIFLMFIRLLLAYFHLFASLATTGVGLITLGILILLGVWLYSKFKDRLFRYLQQKV